ncbi:hypothetical protein FQN52_006104 [Onygenales sp. PD_12]|nr:hypothetical protein FQN53_004270 [Emmonsiellopsis sp. PD_33]KAK2795178.1 hypothetical protein FQN52_006104 [Onygenales sp. PD_12]
MVLLTSSTISVAISSSIIGLFTFLLFLSGYVLQQQSVRGIQAAISPSTTTAASRYSPPLGGSPAAAYVIVNQGKDAFYTPDVVVPDGDGSGESGRGKFGKAFGNPITRPVAQDVRERSRHKQAYLQMISKPNMADICSGLLFFKTLASKSDIPSDKVFLYPQSWDLHSPTKGIAAVLNLLRQHQDEYNIVLHAIDMTDPNYRSPSNTRLLSKASHKLTHYEKILYVRSPGILANSTKLDDLFLSPPPTSSPPSSSSYSSSYWSWRNKRKAPRDDEPQSETWVPTRLSTVNPDLPYAFLVTMDHAPSGGVSIRTHVPVPSVKQSLIVPAIPRISPEKAADLRPAYVFFEKDRDVQRERETGYYREWKEQVRAVCEGADVGD